VTVSEDWEREARNWIAWARAPGHDSYWEHSGPPFFGLLPAAGRATLEVGCGEGRVARDLAARGHRVTGVDASPTLLAAAREADPAGRYVFADAAALPFDDATYDLVVAFNSLMDIEDMPRAVRESARVLAPGGRLCVCITDPLADAGRWERREADAPFVIEGSYFGRRRFEGTFERDGLVITFPGWCYPLEDYFRALEEAGLIVDAMRESRAPKAAVRRDPAAERWRRIPNFSTCAPFVPDARGRRGRPHPLTSTKALAHPKTRAPPIRGGVVGSTRLPLPSLPANVARNCNETAKTLLRRHTRRPDTLLAGVRLAARRRTGPPPLRADSRDTARDRSGPRPPARASPAG